MLSPGNIARHERLHSPRSACTLAAVIVRAQATKATAEAEQMEQLADWGGLSRAMAASAKRWLCACPAEGCGGAICAYGQECEVCGSVSRSCTECGRKAYQPGTQRMRCNTCGAKNPFE